MMGESSWGRLWATYEGNTLHESSAMEVLWTGMAYPRIDRAELSC